MVRRYVSIPRRPQVSRSPPEQRGILFVGYDEFDEVFDIELGKLLDVVFSDAKDPDEPVLDFHPKGDVT